MYTGFHCPGTSRDLLRGTFSVRKDLIVASDTCHVVCRELGSSRIGYESPQVCVFWRTNLLVPLLLVVFSETAHAGQLVVGMFSSTRLIFDISKIRCGIFDDPATMACSSTLELPDLS